MNKRQAATGARYDDLAAARTWQSATNMRNTTTDAYDNWPVFNIRRIRQEGAMKRTVGSARNAGRESGYWWGSSCKAIVR